MFELILNHTAHNMRAIESHTLTAEQVQRVEHWVCANWSHHPGYQMKSKGGFNPFLQGMTPPYPSDRNNGWVLVEIWGARDEAKIPAIKEWIAAQNEHVFRKE